MAGHGRPRGIRCLGMRFCDACRGALVAICFAQTAPAAPPRQDLPVPPALEDAELADVRFVDAQRGWAVGDRGVIWHTADGGRRWELQFSGVDCRLESIDFLDADNGWVAGTVYTPHLHATRGVLLITHDGGRTWTLDQTAALPGLKRIKFFSAAQGWAIGDGSPLFPSGVFATDNGGRTWTPLSGAAEAGWLAGDFVDPVTGALAGRRGSLATVRRRGLEESGTPPLGLRGLRRLKLVAPLAGWLVGDGGLVLNTGDLGRTWQLPAGELPEGLAEQFDWRALDVRGAEAWIAGSPGTRVLHTPDAGRTWQSFATGQNPPLTSLAFVDPQHGWAVGALGAILATSDGGRTWQRQRGGGTRAALVGFFGQPQSVPLELFAKLSGNEGYLGVVQCLARQDLDAGSPEALATLPERSHAALVTVGASGAETAWCFPQRQDGLALSAEQIIEGWNRVHDGRGSQQLEAYLVRQIRCWRPEVIVTAAASASGDDPLANVLNQAVLRAVEQAADGTRFAEQTALAGLAPWKATKVYGCLPSGQLGTTNVTTAQLAPRLGRSLSDQAALARGLFEEADAAPPATQGFRLLIDRVPQGAGEQDFFSGIALAPGGDARRTLDSAPAQDIEALRRIAQRHRNVQAIVASSERSSVDGVRLLAQIGDVARGLDEATAGEVLFELAASYRRTGRWELAAEILELLPNRYPNHRLTPAALVWLVQYYASGEAAWRARRAPRLIADQPQPPAPEQTRTLGQVLPVGDRPEARVNVARAQSLVVDGSAEIDRPARAAHFAKLLERMDTALHVDPRVQFPLAAVHRSQGLAQQADRYYFGLARSRSLDAWSACAAGEQWLSEPQGLPPKGIDRVPRTDVRPKLDGRLDEPFWRRARPMTLSSAQRDDADWPAVAMLAYDDEFLYLAIDCRRAEGCAYGAAEGVRPRDADLSHRDRVEVFLDIDRDWTTCYRLSVDHRGWTADSCWGDATWNPRWFVAASQNDTSWRIEAAIPLAELAPHKPAARDAWVIGVQRTVPGVGFQSWTLPASTAATPEGFGYLIFE
jgi:photosystem II stability/assembly factor-like uncharacterized protein